jgi:hypothetical protein
MTPEAVKQILTAVRLGFWPDRAATLAGVTPATMRAMRMRDPEFATALEMAEAQAELNFHGKILKASESSWSAAAWIMERRFGQRWGRRDPDAVEAAEKLAAGIVEAAQVGPPVPSTADLRMQIQKLSQLSKELLPAPQKTEPAEQHAEEPDEASRT